MIKNNISPDKLVPGTGQCSIRDTVFFTKTVAKLNVKAVLILPPFYYKNVHNEGIIEYFRRVVEGVGDSKLHYLLYQIPQMSGVHLGFDVIEKLLNFIGTKEIYSSRIVNSIYFDTYFHKNFDENLNFWKIWRKFYPSR